MVKLKGVKPRSMQSGAKSCIVDFVAQTRQRSTLTFKVCKVVLVEMIRKSWNRLEEFIYAFMPSMTET